MHTITYCGQNISLVHPDHLRFDWTTYDNINDLAGSLVINVPRQNILWQSHK